MKSSDLNCPLSQMHFFLIAISQKFFATWYSHLIGFAISKAAKFFNKQQCGVTCFFSLHTSTSCYGGLFIYFRFFDLKVTSRFLVLLSISLCFYLILFSVLNSPSKRFDKSTVCNSSINTMHFGVN